MDTEKETRPDISCPFCEDSGFDLIGLKIHITSGWCDVFESTPVDFDSVLEQIERDRQ